MELDGDAKRIRALFYELSFADQRHTPRFNTLWSRAESAGVIRTQGLFTTPLVVAFVTLIIVAAAALAAWSWTKSTIESPVQNAINIPTPITSTPVPESLNSRNSSTGSPNRNSHPRRKRSEPRYRTREVPVADVALLSSWQSPTNILMQPAIGAVFNSLPQLNTSVEELKQFLPKANEATKESNQ